MAKKATAVKAVKTKRTSPLESPVHNLLGYFVLLLLAIVVLAIVQSLKWFIVPQV